MRGYAPAGVTGLAAMSCARKKTITDHANPREWASALLPVHVLSMRRYLDVARANELCLLYHDREKDVSAEVLST